MAQAMTTESSSLYDFSGVASDLAILRSQLFTLNIGGSQSQSVKMDTYLKKELEEPDDEEWYPPSPPIYDVADKLIEINREHYNDPTPSVHNAGRLRWKPEDRLVQIKWLDNSDGENNFMSETEDENSSDEQHFLNSSGGLAAQLAKEMQARLNLSLCNIEDVVLEEPQDYDDEDFEEASIAENISEVKSPLRDTEIISQMEVLHNDEMSVSSNSSSSESCRTTMTSLKNVNENSVPKKNSPSPNSSLKSNSINSVVTTPPTVTMPPALVTMTPQQPPAAVAPAKPTTTKIIVTNSSLSESLKVSNSNSKSDSKKDSNAAMQQRPTSRPRTKTTVVRTHNPLPKLRSNSLPKSSDGNGKRLSCNNNNSCSSSGEEGSSSSTSGSGSSFSSGCSSLPSSRHHHSGLSRSYSLQPGKSRSESRESSSRKVITNSTENRPKKAKTSVYLGGCSKDPPGLNGVPARPVPSNNTYHRKNSRNSLSSNSSISSQTTEDSTANISNLNFKRKIHHRHPSVIADVISPQNPYFLQWKMRKREEKKLRERKSFLEQQMRRH